MRGDSNERLTILSETEKTALYGVASPNPRSFLDAALRPETQQSPAAMGDPGVDPLLHGVATENGFQSTLSRCHRSKRPKLTRPETRATAPNVVAGQVDVFPAEW